MKTIVRYFMLIGVCLLLLPAYTKLPDLPLLEAVHSIKQSPHLVSLLQGTNCHLKMISMVNITLPDEKQTVEFGQAARVHLEDIANKFGARVPGSEEEATTASYIQSVLKRLNYEVIKQEFQFTNEEDQTSLNSANLIAIKQGDSARQIILGAHYDSPAEGAKGADDNASGVALLLEMAQKIKNIQTPYTIRFIAFGSEENNLDGSKYYVQQMDEKEIQNTIVMINLDSLISGDNAYIFGKSAPGSVRDWIVNYARESGLNLQPKKETDMFKPDGSHCDCSDIDSFLNANIPFVLFETNKLDVNREGTIQTDEKFGVDGAIRHTEYDTIEYIDKQFPGRIDAYFNLFGKLVYKVLTEYKE